MTYGTHTWSVTTQAENKHVAAKIEMKTSMLNITYKYNRTNIWVVKWTNVADIIGNVRTNEMVLGMAHQL